MATTINADTSTGGAVVSGDASGVLGLQAAGSTQVTISTSGVVLANPLPVASGGTGGSATPTAGGVVYGTGTAQAVTTAGTSGYLLQSNGASAPSWVAAPSGGVTSVATSGGLTGGTITSTGTLSINTNNSVGVGAYAFVFTVAGSSSVADGSTTAGSNLNPAGTNNGSFGADTGVTLAGTWRNVSGRTAAGNGSGYGLFIRTA